MTEQEIRAILETAQKIEYFYLMGTTAYHLLGDISRPDDGRDNLFQAYKETDDYWVGAWNTGFGFIDVLFPKDACRELNEEEVEYFNKARFQIGSQPPYKVDVVPRNKRVKLDKDA